VFFINLATQKLIIGRMSLLEGVAWAVLSKVDDFATFKKVEVHAENSTF